MKNRERGATLIELLVAVSIWALVGIAVTGGIFIILRNADINSNHMSAVLQLQRVDQAVSKDANTAQLISVNVTAPDLLTMSWIDGDNGDEYEVTYTMEAMSQGTLMQLRRTLDVNGSSNFTSVVASYIDSSPAMTNCQFSDGVLTLTVTATVGGGSTEESETRTYKVVTRPG